jgi:hypothetical protein
VRQHSQLVFWLRHHWIIPAQVEGWEVEIRRDDAVWTQLAASTPGGLHVWAGAFDDGVRPDWRGDPHWCCSELTDEVTRRDTLILALREARVAGARMVVFPELTVPRALWGDVADEMCTLGGFVLVVPGSFHEANEGVNHNVTCALDGGGTVLFEHTKLLAMRTTNAAGDPLIEAITTGDRITLLETPLGLLAIAVCRDFCEGTPPGAGIWSAIAPGLVLVPSMSGRSTLGAHERRAAELYREHATRTAIAIQPERDEEWREEGGHCVAVWQGKGDPVRLTGAGQRVIGVGHALWATSRAVPTH